MLKRLGAGMLSFAAPRSLPALEPRSRGKRMGVVVSSYRIRRSNKNNSVRYPPFRDAIELLEHCHSYGAGGVQVGVFGWETVFAKKVRDRREQLGMFIEGQIRLPKDEADLPAFESSVKAAQEAGANTLRVGVGARRYEQFDSLEGFRAMKAQAWKSFRLAEPIVARRKVKLGIENHKDWRIPDMLEFMEGLSSEWIGACIDTGNSIALLEHPMETVEAFAKYAMTTHVKDMRVKEYEDGFLLSEVPLGEGFVDLGRVLDLCEQANPGIRFCLEMITRDPLKIPCLKDQYWATFDSMKPARLAGALAMVRKESDDRSMPSVSGRSLNNQLRYEETNIRKSFEYAASRLGLGG